MNGDVYLCEGYYNYHKDFRKPHMLTVWAVGRGEYMILARPKFHEFTAGMLSKDERLAEAERDAREFLGEPRN